MSCQRCRMKNRTCVTWTSGFDFTLTDHVISVMNAELVDMYVDVILSSLTLLMGVDVAAQIMSRIILYRQDARLQEGRAPRVDPSEAGAPLECRVDVLVRMGAGCEQFLERSFVPFQLWFHILAMVENTIWPELDQNTSNKAQYESFTLSLPILSVYFALSGLLGTLFTK
ncbi:hypothetical protein B0H14DRAFT_2623192 [Mycena olivaceomarginata]|nr:hypothetical protein B0H14DRAFT_2623192 [Mycena olivaceomarginata]